MRISSNKTIMTATFLFCLIAMSAGMTPHVKADPLEFLVGADREKLRLNWGIDNLGSSLNSKQFRLSLESANPTTQVGSSSLFERSRENNNNFGSPKTIDSIAIGAQHQLNEQWAVSANLAWFKSELYDGLTQSAPPDIIIPVVWDETTRYILGVCFTPADRWAVQAKVFLDKPLINFSYGKDFVLSDQSRLWLAATVDYHIQNDLSFDLDYTRVSMNSNGPFANGVADNASGNENAVAERRTSIDLISASLTIQF